MYLEKLSIENWWTPLEPIVELQIFLLSSMCLKDSGLIQYRFQNSCQLLILDY